MQKRIKYTSEFREEAVKLALSSESFAAFYFSEKCFNNNGARELDRAIDTHIKQAIADEILFGKLKNGGSANVD